MRVNIIDEKNLLDFNIKLYFNLIDFKFISNTGVYISALNKTEFNRTKIVSMYIG